MKKYKWGLILFNLILLLLYFNYSILKKEEQLNEGQLVLLELAPVDPRSLIEGDYMFLRYKISQEDEHETTPKNGYCVIRIDSNGVAERLRFQQDREPLNAGEHLLRYHHDDWNITIGAESYFFQEGQEKKYGEAKYGGLKIDKDGNSILVGLYDAQRKKIE